MCGSFKDGHDTLKLSTHPAFYPPLQHSECSSWACSTGDQSGKNYPYVIGSAWRDLSHQLDSATRPPRKSKMVAMAAGSRDTDTGDAIADQD